MAIMDVRATELPCLRLREQTTVGVGRLELYSSLVIRHTGMLPGRIPDRLKRRLTVGPSCQQLGSKTIRHRAITIQCPASLALLRCIALTRRSLRWRKSRRF